MKKEKPGKLLLILGFYFTYPRLRLSENKTDIWTPWKLTDLSQSLAPVSVTIVAAGVRHVLAWNLNVVSCMTLAINLASVPSSTKVG